MEYQRVKLQTSLAADIPQTYDKDVGDKLSRLETLTKERDDVQTKVVEAASCTTLPCALVHHSSPRPRAPLLPAPSCATHRARHQVWRLEAELMYEQREQQRLGSLMSGKFGSLLGSIKSLQETLEETYKALW
jgi:hypothetical protein